MSPRVIVNEQKLWPLRPRDSLAATIGSLAVLLLLAVLLKTAFHWPGEHAEAALLIGIAVISLLPVALAVADLLIEHGGAFQLGDFKLDFSAQQRAGRIGVTVKGMLGARGEALHDSGTAEILDALRSATESRIAIVNLEGGEAWWETRLLVLLEGGDRLGFPASIVFTANQRGQSLFQGWAPTSELLESMVAANARYARHVADARAASRQWSLIEPPPVALTAAPPQIQGLISPKYYLIAFDYPSGLPNPFLTELILQDQLGLNVEAPDGDGHPIGLSRLESLFGPVLRHAVIELTATREIQLQSIVDAEGLEVAMVECGEYVAMVPKANVAVELLRQLLSPDAKPN